MCPRAMKATDIREAMEDREAREAREAREGKESREARKRDQKQECYVGADLRKSSVTVLFRWRFAGSEKPASSPQRKAEASEDLQGSHFNP